MRLKAKEAVPDHYRRAVRLATATAIVATLGFSLASRPGYEKGPLVLILKWALITLPVVTMPLLGKTSQVGAERVLGTIAGGLLGFLASAVATGWWTLQAGEADALLLAAAAAAASFFSVLVGKRLNLDLSARLFVIAFVIVSFNALQGKDPFQVAVTRIAGIVSGVLTMVVMSVLILPKSASIESLRTLRSSLQKLAEINTAVWGTYLPTAAPPPKPPQRVSGSSGKARKPGQGGGTTSGRSVTDSALQEPLLPPPEGDVEAGQPGRPAQHDVAPPAVGQAGTTSPRSPEEHDALLLASEKALTDLYALLDDAGEQLGLAKREVWVCSCWGHPFLLPGMPFWATKTNHLPWKELKAVADAVRRVARLLNTALFTLQDGFVEQLQDVLGPLYPAGLMPQLARDANAAIQELFTAFPNDRQAGSAGLAAFSASVESLAEVSDQQRRQVLHALRRYRSRAAARSSWSHLINAALQQRTEDTPFETGPLGGFGPTQTEAAGTLAGGGFAPDGIAEGSGGGGLAGTEAAGIRAGGGFAPDGSGADVGSSGVDVSGSGGTEDPPRIVAATREASLSGWLQRFTSVRGGSGAESAAADAAVHAVHAADAPPQGSTTAGSPAAAAATPAATPATTPAPPSPGMLRQSGSQGQLLPRGLALQEAPSAILPLKLFPETPEGHLAQISWYSFQFLVEELAEQLAVLHAAVNAVLSRLPE